METNKKKKENKELARKLRELYTYTYTHIYVSGRANFAMSNEPQ